MSWLHVTNNTGFPLVLYWAGDILRLGPGRWCLSGKPPHCQPKERQP